MKLNIDANPGSSELDTNPHENGPHNNLNSFKGCIQFNIEEERQDTCNFTPLFHNYDIRQKNHIFIFRSPSVIRLCALK